MTDINKISDAMKIYQQLDKLDGKEGDGHIDAEIWNAFAGEKGGKGIKVRISEQNAIKSIGAYLKRNAAKENIDPHDLAQRWINANEEALMKTPEKTKELEEQGFVLHPTIPEEIKDLLEEKDLNQTPKAEKVQTKNTDKEQKVQQNKSISESTKTVEVTTQKIQPPADKTQKVEQKRNRTTQNIEKYKLEFAEYNPRTQLQKTKYDRVITRIKSNRNLRNKDDAKYIANMVCTLADRYGIDAEIVENILERESQFQFTPRVMQHPGSKYKGVAQVSFGHIKSMYFNTEDRNNNSLTDKDRKHAADHRHYSQDQKRIDELKQNYPTPESLYKAIQSDVSLGLEVGIMAYKAHLSMRKGSTVGAMAMYCGSQYALPADSLNAATAPIPRRYEHIPEYRA